MLLYLLAPQISPFKESIFFLKDTDKMQSLAMGLGVLRHHGGTDAVKEEQCLPEALRESLWLVDSDSPSRDNWRLSRVH